MYISFSSDFTGAFTAVVSVQKVFLFQKTSFSPSKLTDHAFPTLTKLKLGEEGKESRLGLTWEVCLWVGRLALPEEGKSILSYLVQNFLVTRNYVQCSKPSEVVPLKPPCDSPGAKDSTTTGINRTSSPGSVGITFTQPGWGS